MPGTNIAAMNGTVMQARLTLWARPDGTPSARGGTPATVAMSDRKLTLQPKPWRSPAFEPGKMNWKPTFDTQPLPKPKAAEGVATGLVFTSLNASPPAMLRTESVPHSPAQAAAIASTVAAAEPIQAEPSNTAIGQWLQDPGAWVDAWRKQGVQSDGRNTVQQWADSQSKALAPLRGPLSKALVTQAPMAGASPEASLTSLLGPVLNQLTPQQREDAVQALANFIVLYNAAVPQSPDGKYTQLALKGWFPAAVLDLEEWMSRWKESDPVAVLDLKEWMSRWNESVTELCAFFSGYADVLPAALREAQAEHVRLYEKYSALQQAEQVQQTEQKKADQQYRASTSSLLGKARQLNAFLQHKPSKADTVYQDKLKQAEQAYTAVYTKMLKEIGGEPAEALAQAAEACDAARRQAMSQGLVSYQQLVARVQDKLRTDLQLKPPLAAKPAHLRRG